MRPSGPGGADDGKGGENEAGEGAGEGADEGADEGNEAGKRRRLLLIARGGREAAELEFIAGPGEENLEDRMVLLAERGGRRPSTRSRFGCCATTPRPCATSSTTARTS